MPDFNNMIELNVGLYIFSSLILIFILFGVIRDKKIIKKSFLDYFIIQICCCVCMLISEMFLWLFEGFADYIYIIKLFLLLSFIFGYLMVAFYSFSLFDIVKEKKYIKMKFPYMILLTCIFFILFLLIFNDSLFYVDKNGMVQYTDLYFIINIFDFFMLFLDIIFILYYRKLFKNKQVLSLLTFSIFPLIAMPLQIYWDTTPLYISNVFSILVLYFFFYSEVTVKLVESEKLVAEMRTALILKRMTPHFIFNSLANIESLCKIDSQKAANFIQNFSKFLHNSFKEFDNKSPILISLEIENTKNYINIEKIRFPDIEFIFNVTSDNFFIPSLTLQELIENSIKHGFAKKNAGCVIKISTFETEDYYCVEVMDNGIGFDTLTMCNAHKFGGLNIIDHRLKIMCNGEMKITSKKNIGTEIILYIPKELS